MEKLRRKTFYTIFGIISLFIIIILLFFNIQSYQREYSNIENNLRRMNNVLGDIKNVDDKVNIDDDISPKKELDNRIIMDYNVYTVIFDSNNNIVDIINHSYNEFDSDIEIVVKEIISNNEKDDFRIGNLYFSKYSYNLKRGGFLTIVDNSKVRDNLLLVLGSSIIIFVLFEIIIFYISKLITNWIIKPAIDSFNKQKEFISDASHELKTPLSVIIASAEALENDRNEIKWLNNIKNETERMNKLVVSLLDLSRLESGINKNTYSLNNISKIVEKASLTFEGLAYDKKVEIKANIENDIMLKCSTDEISELVSILLDNAIKHSFEKSIIRVNLYKDKSEIILDIINNGDMIPKDKIDNIFERFYRGDESRNRRDNRYGLGLAIAKNIVINHNGKIKAISKDNYTTFRVVFKNK